MASDQTLAALFAAFAHPSRIAILRALLAHSTTGQTFGALSKAVGIAPSTLTHHLREIEAAGVLIRTVTGRQTQLRLDLTVITAALGQLTSLCCGPQTPPTPERTPPL